jgi:hypothetical protein
VCKNFNSLPTCCKSVIIMTISTSRGISQNVKEREREGKLAIKAGNFLEKETHGCGKYPAFTFSENN